MLDRCLSIDRPFHSRYRQHDTAIQIHVRWRSHDATIEIARGVTVFDIKLPSTRNGPGKDSANECLKSSPGSCETSVEVLYGARWALW